MAQPSYVLASPSPSPISGLTDALRGLRLWIPKGEDKLPLFAGMLWTPSPIVGSPGPADISNPTVGQVGAPIGDGKITSLRRGLHTHANLLLRNNDNNLYAAIDATCLDPIKFPANLGAGVQAVCLVAPWHDVIGGQGSVLPMAAYFDLQTSAVATPQTVVYDISELHNLFVMAFTCSAGTATYEADGSNDNATWLTHVTVGAAAAGGFSFTPASTPAGTGVSPLGFRYIRIKIGSAGAGNTTTMQVGIK